MKTIFEHKENPQKLVVLKKYFTYDIQGKKILSTIFESKIPYLDMVSKAKKYCETMFES
jgi:hypothetical protein